MTPGLLRLDCAHLSQPDVGTVADIALLKVIAARQGLLIRLENPGPELVQLIEFCGLSQVLGVAPPAGS
jgi:hypothetical protein